jgi:hypothetical protein
VVLVGRDHGGAHQYLQQPLGDPQPHQAGAGISLLPTSILSRHRASQLRVLRAQPQIGRPRLYGAYQLEKAGPVIAAVMGMTRKVVASEDWVVRE